MNEMKIILVGLGHEMHGDDEVGLEIVRRWAEKEIPGVQTALLESPGLNLLGVIAGRDAAILVAAIRVGAPLGSVQVFHDLESDTFRESNKKGSGWGAAETLSLGRQLIPEDLPGKLILVGIEGAAFGLGEGLSPAVRGAIPEAVCTLDKILNELKWVNQPFRGAFYRMISKLRKIFAGRDQR